MRYTKPHKKNLKVVGNWLAVLVPIFLSFKHINADYYGIDGCFGNKMLLEKYPELSEQLRVGDFKIRFHFLLN